MRYAIDPGHGSTQRGCAAGALVEKDYTLEIARRLKAALWDLGHAATLTREADDIEGKPVDFTTRARRAQTFAADRVLSLHVNANPSPACKGMRTYYMPGDHIGKELAAIVLRYAPRALARVLWRRSAQVIVPLDPYAATLDGLGDDAVLRRYHVPAALCEMGFATNDDDRAYMLSEVGKRQIVSSIAAALDAGEEII